MHNMGKSFIAVAWLTLMLMPVYAHTMPSLAAIETANGYEVTNVTQSSTFNVNICGKNLYVVEEAANSTYAKLSINYFEYLLRVGSKQSLATLQQNCYVELLNISDTSAQNTTSFLFSKNVSNTTTINASSKNITSSVTTIKISTLQQTINVTTVAVSINSTQTSANPFQQFWTAMASLLSKLLGRV